MFATRRNWHELTALVFVLLVFLPACKSLDPKTAELLEAEAPMALSGIQAEKLDNAKQSVVRVWTDQTVFSAVCIGEGRILTAAHCLRDIDFPVSLLFARALQSPPGSDDFSAIRLSTVSKRGDPTSLTSDWTELIVDSAGLEVIAVDSSTPLHFGEAVYVLGYPLVLDGKRRHSLEVVPARVSRDKDGVVILILPPGYRENLSGLSGGAVVRWNGDRQEFEMVALAARMESIRGAEQFPFLKAVRPLLQ